MENVERKEEKKKMSVTKKVAIGLGIAGIGAGIFLAGRRYGVKGGVETLKNDFKTVGSAMKKPFVKKADAQVVNEETLMEEVPQIIEQPQQPQQQPQYNNSGNRNNTSWSSARRDFYNNNKR